PELLRAYRDHAYPINQPPFATLQLMGYRYAFLAAYGEVREGVTITP
ncbi:MAG: hypothetical protein HOV94_24640, partial [Saccharothrix sp.]|nr:hypothetical protein [Saccharothrix sp.]